MKVKYESARPLGSSRSHFAIHHIALTAQAPASSTTNVFTTMSRLSTSSSSSQQQATPSKIALPPTRMLQDARFKLFVRVHSGKNLQTVTQGTYCKLYLGDTIMVSGSQSALMQFNLLNDSATTKVNNATGKTNPNANAQSAPLAHREFRTHVEYPTAPAHPVWNEKFEVGVFDPSKEVISIRVKSQQMVYCPTIGACAIYLKQLKLGETVDQWLPLHKGQRASGHIRLQLLLSINENARAIQQPVKAAVNANAAVTALQKQRQEELLRQKLKAEKEAAERREEEERRARRKAEKEKEKEKERRRAEKKKKEEEEEERRRQRRKAEKKEKARLVLEEQEMERARLAHKEKERVLRAMRAADESEEEDNSRSSTRHIYTCSSDEDGPTVMGKKAAKPLVQPVDNQVEDGMHHALEDAATKVVEAMANAGFESDGSKTIEYVSASGSSSSSSKRKSVSKTKKKPSSRTSSRSSSKLSFLAAAQAIEDEIQRVEQNALPSDSSDDDSDSSSMSSEEERRLLRKLKEKKKRRKEKAAKLKAKLKKKAKSKKSKAVESESELSSSLSSSSSSSSSESTSSDEKRKRKEKKSKAKSSKKDLSESQSSGKSKKKDSPQWTEYISTANDMASLYSTLTGGGDNQDGGGIQAISQLDLQQDGGGIDLSSMGDWLQGAASSVSSLMTMDSSEDFGDGTAAAVGLMTAGVVPIGMYLGKKLRRASANSMQQHQEQTQQRYSVQINSLQKDPEQHIKMAMEAMQYANGIDDDNNNALDYEGQQGESTYYF